MTEFGKTEFRAIIHFLYSEKVGPTDAAERLRSAYGDSAPDRSTISRWMKRFGEGRTSLEDDPRSGRPTTATDDANIERVRELLDDDRRLNFDQLEEALGINRERLHHIIHEELGMTKVSARWVPRLLTSEQKKQRVVDSRVNLIMAEDMGDRFWDRFLTVDATWFPYYNPETKAQSMQWVAKGERPPLKAKVVPSAGKVMLTIFWDCKGIVHIDYLPPGQNINADYYSALLRKVDKELDSMRPGKKRLRILLLQDNARPHTARTSIATIRDLGWAILPHPAYSPDLAPSDYYLFGPLKQPLRGQRFGDLNEMKLALKSVIKGMSDEWFAHGCKKLLDRWNACIEKQGDYVEK